MLNKRIIFKKPIKELRKVYGLGKDITCMNIEGNEYIDNEYVYQHCRNLWLDRSKYGRSPKSYKVKDFKLLVKVKGVESAIDAKL
jgi:hypothetical protein